MKKFISLFLLCFIFLCSTFLIFKFNYNDSNSCSNNYINNSTDDNEFRSVFISYIDYSILKGKTSLEKKEIIDEMVLNIKKFKFNNIILQVRSFADAIYDSDIFLSSAKVVENEGDKLDLDILSYFIDKAHEEDISLYAWINPYRIRSSSSSDDIGHDSIFLSWFGTDNIITNDEGIYFNPSSDEVLNLILSGVEEIVSKYEVDGILYDDYFYPETDMDLDNYNNYIKEYGDISLSNYRINVINKLTSSTYNLIKSYDKNILFGISPSGNISNNLNNEYLDVSYIIENKYIDFIIPQIYYGFSNQNKPFIDTVKEWNDLVNNDISLYIGLALYKAGNVDNNALSGSLEWVNNSDVIKKQIIYDRGIDISGFSLFRYSYLVDYYNDNLTSEVNNIINLMD